MADPEKVIWVINAGSSSIKFAAFRSKAGDAPLYDGKITRIGSPDAELRVHRNGEEAERLSLQAASFGEAISTLLDYFQDHIGWGEPLAIAHRIVYGMHHRESRLATPELLTELEAMSGLDPDHMPAGLQLVREFQSHHPDIPQVLCFDTAFHRSLPKLARLLPLPRRFFDQGVQRYGFHGLSYTYLMQSLKARFGDDIVRRKIVLAHLGSGSSLAAVRNGQSVETSMGFTPTGGVMMGTRTGDLDPGVLLHLIQQKQLAPQELNDLLNHESGLLGVSGISDDMQRLLSIEHENGAAAEAVNLYCYTVKKWIGALAAVLNGLDILVFSGGIGEQAPIIRARITDGLGHLGISIDPRLNRNGETIISQKDRTVQVLVIPTNEELVMVNDARVLLQRAGALV